MTNLRPGDEFEQLVADTFRELWPCQSLIPDDKVLGKSGVRRQIDLSARGTTALGLDVFKIVEAKDWNQRIPIGEIEKLHGLLDDVQADEAAMVAGQG